jgi:hypothetical protein
MTHITIERVEAQQILDALESLYPRTCKHEIANLKQALAQPTPVPLTDEQIDKAATKLAECMDYPWAQMPEQGKLEMRNHAKAVIEASGITKGQP